MTLAFLEHHSDRAPLRTDAAAIFQFALGLVRKIDPWLAGPDHALQQLYLPDAAGYRSSIGQSRVCLGHSTQCAVMRTYLRSDSLNLKNEVIND